MSYNWTTVNLFQMKLSPTNRVTFLFDSWSSTAYTDPETVFVEKGVEKTKVKKALLLKAYTPRISQEPPNAYDKITAAMDSTGFHNFVSMERSLVLSTKRTGRSSHLLFEAGFLWQQMVLLAPPLQCWPLLLLTHLQTRTKSSNEILTRKLESLPFLMMSIFYFKGNTIIWQRLLTWLGS